MCYWCLRQMVYAQMAIADVQTFHLLRFTRMRSYYSSTSNQAYQQQKQLDHQQQLHAAALA